MAELGTAFAPAYWKNMPTNSSKKEEGPAGTSPNTVGADERLVFVPS